MARFNVDFDESKKELFDIEMESDEELDADFGEVQQVVTSNYERLQNKPSINNIELIGDKSSEDLKIVLRGTKAEWDSQPSLLSEKNVIYIYTDHQTIDNGDGTYTIIPAIKIGDGKSYLIDMPFAAADSSLLEKHIANNTVHVTEEEKAFWNSKWRGYIDEANPTLLVFTTN